MRNTLLITTTILALLLSGCGHDEPREVAKTFAGALSSADMDEVKELVAKDASVSIVRLKTMCSKQDAKKLYTETVEVIDKIDKRAKKDKFSKKAKETLATLEKDISFLQKEIEKEIRTKYGSPKSIPVEEKEKMMEIAFQKLMGVINPAVKKILDILEIKTEHSQDVRKIISEFMVKGGSQMRINRRNRYVLQDIVEKVLLERKAGVTEQCVAKYTKFGNIDEINVIETIQRSPDIADVRLELISKDEKSKKVSVDMEKIKNEWKVSTFYVDTGF